MTSEHLTVICLFMFSLGYVVGCFVEGKTRSKD